MFMIIGGDGREYGPATVDQIRAWIAAGRANFETKAKAVGADEWRRLGDLPEFAPQSDTPPVIERGAPAGVGGVGAAATSVVGPTLADRVERLGAWFVDNVILFIMCLPGFIVLGTSLVMSLLKGNADLGGVDAGRVLLGSALLAAGGLTLLIVQLWMLTTRGQTVGKRVLGIRIVRHLDGGNPGFVSAVLLRTVVPGLIGMVPYVGFMFTLVDICFIFRDDRRCVHDLIANTVVVKA